LCFTVYWFAANDNNELEWPQGYFDEACGFFREDVPDPADRRPEPVEPREHGQ